jgi:hypothetical protein
MTKRFELIGEAYGKKRPAELRLVLPDGPYDKKPCASA